MSKRTDLLLSIADDELILGWRNSEWTGIAPFLEEDVAFSSIAQNEIGHARALYELVARGALGCWFGAGGPLKTSHVFQAEAAPPAEGGAAEIVLHERELAGEDVSVDNPDYTGLFAVANGETTLAEAEGPGGAPPGLGPISQEAGVDPSELGG